MVAFRTFSEHQGLRESGILKQGIEVVFSSLTRSTWRVGWWGRGPGFAWLLWWKMPMFGMDSTSLPTLEASGSGLSDLSGCCEHSRESGSSGSL